MKGDYKPLLTSFTFTMKSEKFLNTRVLIRSANDMVSIRTQISLNRYSIKRDNLIAAIELVFLLFHISG